MNPQNKFTLAIRDTATHTIPNGTGAHASMNSVDVRGKDTRLVKIVNGLNQAVKVNVKGSTFDDPSLASPDEELDADVTVAASGTETIVVETDWAFIGLKAKCDVAPANGDLTVVFQSDTFGR